MDSKPSTGTGGGGKSCDTRSNSEISRISHVSQMDNARGSSATQPCTAHSASPTTPSPSPSIGAKVDRALTHLTPAWFTSTMGTGIVSILLYNFPYPAQWLRYIGIIVFVLNVVIFSILAVGNVVRYARYKGLFKRTVDHLAAGMFWGALPMGFATIVNMVAYVCVPKWGGGWAHLAVGLWWIDAIVSVVVNIGMLLAMSTRQKHTPESMSATWLLPIVSSVVAAASGGVVASAISSTSPSLAHSIVIVSFVIWGTGVPVACFMMALYIYRSALHGIPPAAAIPSVLLPVGPCGQGSFGIVLLGRTLRELTWLYGTGFETPSSLVGGQASARAMADAVYAACLCTGLILWGLGLVWYILGMSIFLRHSLSTDKTYLLPSKFTLALYATTFPIGVLATGAYIIAQELDSEAMRVIGAFLAVQVTLSWVWVAVGNVWGVERGTVWKAPEVGADEVQKRGRGSVGDVEKQ